MTFSSALWKVNYTAAKRLWSMLQSWGSLEVYQTTTEETDICDHILEQLTP